MAALGKGCPHFRIANMLILVDPARGRKLGVEKIETGKKTSDYDFFFLCLFDFASFQLSFPGFSKVHFVHLQSIHFFSSSQREFVQRLKNFQAGEKNGIPMLASACPGEDN